MGQYSRQDGLVVVDLVGMDEVQEQECRDFLNSLDEEDITAGTAIHMANGDRFLSELGVFMPSPTEWGGAWGLPYGSGIVVLDQSEPGQLPDRLVHEWAHLVNNMDLGRMGHTDEWAAVYLKMWQDWMGQGTMFLAGGPRMTSLLATVWHGRPGHEGCGPAWYDGVSLVRREVADG